MSEPPNEPAAEQAQEQKKIDPRTLPPGLFIQVSAGPDGKPVFESVPTGHVRVTEAREFLVQGYLQFIKDNGAV